LVRRYACAMCVSASGVMCLGPPKCVGNEAAMARRVWKSSGQARLGCLVWERDGGGVTC
jgi:hypothetical protein